MVHVEIRGGDEICFKNRRRVRVLHDSDGSLLRDYRGKVAVRNVDTDRLSYIPEHRLINSKRAQIQRESLMICATPEELDWLRHAASLRRLPVAEYVKEAVNDRMRREGVDAVLFKVKSEAHL